MSFVPPPPSAAAPPLPLSRFLFRSLNWYKSGKLTHKTLHFVRFSDGRFPFARLYLQCRYYLILSLLASTLYLVGVRRLQSALLTFMSYPQASRRASLEALHSEEVH